jgi:arylsulfatase A-like enzyme
VIIEGVKRLGAGLVCLLAACTGSAPPAQPAPKPNVLLITIDTLRADRVGAYGDRTARTPSLDALAREGTRFDRAYATAPITLTSHATLMTGRYPPGHGARHNGMRLDLAVPTLADAFTRAGASTAAFVAAFPLDRRFGLIKGFQTYGDTMPRDQTGHQANERPGRAVADEALAWLDAHRQTRFLLWVHLFEPHAPYGNPADPAQARRPIDQRYDEEVAEADAQAGRVIRGVQTIGAPVLIVAAADHGEAFGEHGEVSHSLFAYDTTLRVPLILSGPGVQTGRVFSDPVSLVDVAPTIAALAGLGAFDSDGVALPVGNIPDLPPKGGSYRQIYSESFAPLLDFGWAPLRTIRAGGWKYIAAPKPELYDLANDPGETRNLAVAEPARAADFARRVDAIAGAALPSAGANADPAVRARLQALGYLSGRPADNAAARPDPKDRRELARRMAEVASGELQGDSLERALHDILRLDPRNPQANVRLGYVLMNKGRCRDAIARFAAAIDASLPGTDALLGRAGCEIALKNPAAARGTLTRALEIEPDNPVASANLGLLLSDTGAPADALPYLQRALTLDPDLHQARFGLAIAFARLGRRTDAAREADELLRRLPAGAPQRDEVQRLLASVR